MSLPQSCILFAWTAVGPARCRWGRGNVSFTVETATATGLRHMRVELAAIDYENP